MSDNDIGSIDIIWKYSMAGMPQKTERKKCVHVHTEECYGEPDEEATSSQIGEEPTECTHICTVESGCIRNTAASSGMNEDDSGNPAG